MRRILVRSLTLVALLGLSASLVSAQDWADRGRMQGRITDADTNKPIEGAKVTVYLGEEGRGPEPVITNKKGRFSVLGLATGSWTVIVEAEGYVPAEGQASVIAAAMGPGQQQNIGLRKIPEEVLEAAKGPDIRGMIESGNSLLSTGKSAEAREKYEAAIAELEPENHPPLLRGIARAYYLEEKPEEAISALQKSLAIDSEDPESLQLITTLLVALGRDEEAAPYMAKLGDDFKLDANTLLNRGIEQYNEGNIEKAAEYFEKVVAENPELPDSYYYRGLIYLNKGDTEAAKADFMKLIEIAPDHAKAAEAKDFLSAL